MSQQNPIRVFVTHAWEESDDYQRIFEYLESARNFYYRNTSAPDNAPSGGTEPAREEAGEGQRDRALVDRLDGEVVHAQPGRPSRRGRVRKG